MIWATLLLVPTIIIQSKIEYAIVLSIIICFFEENHWIPLRSFFSQHQKAILLYFIVTTSILIFSEEVPLQLQMVTFRHDLLILLLIIETFLLCRDYTFVKSLLKLVCICLFLNAIYCLFFEIIEGFNPAGSPLYLLLGVDNSEYFVDMIDQERGIFDYRLQSIFGHPLSLGQYFLVLVPILYYLENKVLSIICIICVSILILLTGTRGAFIPLLIMLVFGAGSFINKNYKIPIATGVIVFSLFFVNYLENNNTGNKSVSVIISSFKFWDDSLQRRNNIHGSDMELRIVQFLGALKEIEENPLFGKGLKYREYYQNNHGGRHPVLLGYESVALLYLVERGWVGLLFFFITLYYMYLVFKQNATDTSIIKLVFIACIISYVMTGVRPLTLAFLGLTCSVICGLNNVNIINNNNNFGNETRTKYYL